jgi:preprotein translocase SecF subunit
MVVGQEISQPNKSMSYKVAIIRITKADDTNLSSDNVLALMTYMSKMYGTIYKFKIESIGPVIGNELKQKAILAVIIALVLQLIYITLRFGNQVRFGIAADIGLFHDLIVMTGVYSLTGRPFDSPFICAILTVIGYSVMDSIVIFDRIRENLKLFKKESYEQAVNISINQTMTRSINTLLTVLLCLFALFFFGGATLKNFAFSLLVGCATGAYSSIFIASPILVIIDEWVKKKEQERVATRRAALAAAAQSKAEKIREQKKEDAPARAGKEKPSEEEEAVDEESPEKTRKKVKSKQRRRYNKLAKKK